MARQRHQLIDLEVVLRRVCSKHGVLVWCDVPGPPVVGDIDGLTDLLDRFVGMAKDVCDTSVQARLFPTLLREGAWGIEIQDSPARAVGASTQPTWQIEAETLPLALAEALGCELRIGDVNDPAIFCLTVPVNPASQ